MFQTIRSAIFVSPMSHPLNSSSPRPRPAIDPGWYIQLQAELDAPCFTALREYLVRERKAHVVYPRATDILRAFQLTPFDAVRVVILGQDPYHGPGQAHGLSFSVPEGVPPPPSLRNIFQEIHRDLGIPVPSNGDLSAWASQGVLLLNTTLTVRAGEAGSHAGHGWERFTDAAISALSRERNGLIFLLWGRHAQAKEALIDPERHYILKAPHPSPLSAHRGFIGCGHFGATNEILAAQGSPPIDWRT
jgi:uracil-DNA glycosylase